MFYDLDMVSGPVGEDDTPSTEDSSLSLRVGGGSS